MNAGNKPGAYDGIVRAECLKYYSGSFFSNSHLFNLLTFFIDFIYNPGKSGMHRTLALHLSVSLNFQPRDDHAYVLELLTP